MNTRALSAYRWRLPLVLISVAFVSGLATAQTAGTEPAFEVATIKPAAPSPDGHTHINYPSGDQLSAANITLVALMEWAYSMPAKQILDGPSWLGSARFDIQAKLNPDSAKGLSSEQERELKRHMVQALLAERCGLKLHNETRTLPAYDLVLAKGGSKLHVSQVSGKTTNTYRSSFHGEGLTTTLIAEQLSQIVGRIVVDKTGLGDRYDLKLQWTPDDEPATDKSAPSLFTAIQEQLGLKLESAKEPLPVLVIDHIDEPSAN